MEENFQTKRETTQESSTIYASTKSEYSYFLGLEFDFVLNVMANAWIFNWFQLIIKYAK